MDIPTMEVRIGKFSDGRAQVVKDSVFTFVADSTLVGDKSCVSVTFPRLYEFLEKGHQILADDGKISFNVLEVSPEKIVTTVANNGELRDGCGLSIQKRITELSVLTASDKEAIQAGIEMGVNAFSIAALGPSMITAMREQPGVIENKIRIFSSIVIFNDSELLDSVISVSDGVVVNRGALGSTVAFSKMAAVQKEIIERCNRAGKPVIVCSQMLDSMITNPRSTRAEASDVANAVLDGTDAVMLSAETAIGRYPLESCHFMNKVCHQTESEIDYGAFYNILRTKFEVGTSSLAVGEALASSAVALTHSLPKCTLMIVLTESGATAQFVSKYRPQVPVLAITTHEATASFLMLVRGIVPYRTHTMQGEAVVMRGVAKALELQLCKSGDLAVLLFGNVRGVRGMTNTLSVIEV
jgi:pyruvate kinase